MTGAKALVKTLEMLGVETAFGIPGAANLLFYDAMYDSSIRHILVRHEQGAAHAAEGYAMATGRVGVCISTSGPGATNLVTGLADAYMDSVPVVALTGQVQSTSIGTDAFQEADIRGITMPITKHNSLVTKGEDLVQTVVEAFHIASTGRPGPVLVDIAKNVQTELVEWHWPVHVLLPGYKPTTKPHASQVRQAADMIIKASRPVLFVGGGITKSRAADELAAFVAKVPIPVVTTLMGRGVFPDSHPLNYGMVGMHGAVAPVGALQRADLIVAVGVRFDDRVTGKLDGFAPGATVIHCDIDPAEIGKNRPADLPIVGDAAAFLTALAGHLNKADLPDWSEWVGYLDNLADKYPIRPDDPPADALRPQDVIRRLGELVGPDAIYVTGVGQHQMWSAHLLPHEKPYTWLTSGGLGTMGYCVPSTMGAKVGRPDAVVWGIDGDGSFQMTMQEMITCAVEGIPIKIAIMNNSTLGMVRQLQTLFYDGRYSATNLGETVPDFVLLAQGMGCVGLRASTPDEVDAVIEQAMAINDRPVVVDFRVRKDDIVFPMVPAGASNDDIMYAKGLRADWSPHEVLSSATLPR